MQQQQKTWYELYQWISVTEFSQAEDYTRAERLCYAWENLYIQRVFKA